MDLALATPPKHLLFAAILAALCGHALVASEATTTPGPRLTLVRGVEPQPLLAQADRLEQALTYLGSPFPEEDRLRFAQLRRLPLDDALVQELQAFLDRYCLAFVHINPEARVTVDQGPAIPLLRQNGWTTFLVKVHNEAGATARLAVESPQAQPLLHMGLFPFSQEAAPEKRLTRSEVEERFLDVQMYHGRPLKPGLSGLPLEYAVLQIYSKDAGRREASLGFNLGAATEDLGFRNRIPILFQIEPAVRVTLRVADDDGSPTMASFTISDGTERLPVNSRSVDYRHTVAATEFWEPWIPRGQYQVPARLQGLYPLPARRMAAYDAYPDFFFQPQVYRADGEHVDLSPGTYAVHFTRGPEYLAQTQTLVVPPGVESVTASFQLRRWINMAALGWYSGDHHVHAAGCSHYESPEAGVDPRSIWRQLLGEDLNIAAVLSWGPGWYHQKQHFSGDDHPLSTTGTVLRYDVEVSGFPSSHAGHVVLLGLREDDYPGTTRIEEWPSWTLPVLTWAKAQGAVTGYAHSGLGLEPVDPTPLLPNLVTPRMDGIGANEYIVAVTHDLVDIYSLGNTPARWELNMWYHTLNAGFRPRISGETDFPCILDERVGLARGYARIEGPLSFSAYLDAIKQGHAYVSDGASHIIDFSVDGAEPGIADSKLALAAPATVRIRARVAAYLTEVQTEEGATIAGRPWERLPYWNIERARIPGTRAVPVELVVNGEAVARQEIIADGDWRDITFDHPIAQPSWVALRILPSCHTNPVFVRLGGQSVRIASSAEWCRRAVDRCWEMKRENIRPAERAAAQAAYDRARAAYERMLTDNPFEEGSVAWAPR